MLTQLPNRRLFIEEANQVILEHERAESKFAFLFIDLDGFKKTNDLYGHDVGDEFTIILRNVQSQKSIEKIVKKMVKVTIYLSKVFEEVNNGFNRKNYWFNFDEWYFLNNSIYCN